MPLVCLLLVTACSDGKVASDTPDVLPCGGSCGSGEVCLANQCRTLCSESAPCPSGSSCLAGACIVDPAPTLFPPVITAIDSNGSIDGQAGHTRRHLFNRLLIDGENLAEAVVTLTSAAGDSRTLEPCETPTNARLVVTLPSDLTAAQYTLTVANQAGACSSNLAILQGEPGTLDASGAQIVASINDALDEDPTLRVRGALAGRVSSLRARASRDAASERSIALNGADLVSSSGAGLFLVIIDTSDHSSVASLAAAPVPASYDMSTDVGRNAVEAHLGNLGSEHLVVLVSTGDVSGAKNDAGLLAALKAVGASRALDSLAAGEAYALIGAAGLGEGNGIEQIGGSARDGRASLATVIVDDAVVGLRRQPSNVAPDLACTGCVQSAEVESLAWTKLTGLPGDFSDGVDNDTTYSQGTGINIAGTVISATLGTSIGNSELDANAVDGGKIQDGAVGDNDIAFNYAVSASKGGAAAGLACSGCVSLGELEADSVNSSKIVNGAIVNEDIGGLSWTKINADMPAGFFDGVDNDTIYGAGTGITINGSNQISSTLGTSVGLGELEADSVNGGKIVNGTVTQADLAAPLVTYGGNLLPNPYFARTYTTSQGTVPEGWTITSVAGVDGPAPTYSVNTVSDGPAGPFAVENAAFTRLYLINDDGIQLDRNGTYRVVGTLRTLAGLNGEATLGVELYDANGVDLTPGTGNYWYVVANLNPGAANVWRRWEGTFGVGTPRPFAGVAANARSMKIVVRLNQDSSGSPNNRILQVQGLGLYQVESTRKIVHYLTGTLSVGATGPWWYSNNHLNGNLNNGAEYTITTTGRPVRIYLKAMTYVYGHGGCGYVYGYLILAPVIDGVVQSDCDHVMTGDPGGAYNHAHAPTVCDMVVNLPPGDHTIGFRAQIAGCSTNLYGGANRSIIIIEEM